MIPRTISNYCFGILLILSLRWHSLYAQIPRTEAIQGQDLGLDSLEYQEPDTLFIREYRNLNFDEDFAVHDRVIGKAFRNVDFGRQDFIEKANLGNVGSAQYSLKYTSQTLPMTRVGAYALNPYLFKPLDLKFYQQNQAYSDFRFTQTNNQAAGSRQNFTLAAVFSRDLMQNLNFSIEYLRSNHSGLYNNQRNKHGFLNMGIAYIPEKSNWKSAIVYTSNIYTNENNGGISDMSLFQDEFFGLRSNIPVQLESAGTRIEDRHFYIQNSYTFRNKKDEFVRFALINHFHRTRSLFSDVDLSDENLEFYQIFAVDTREIRQFSQHDIFSNRFQIESEIGKSRFKNTFLVFGEFARRTFDQELLLDKQSPISLGGEWRTGLKGKADLKIHGKLVTNDSRSEGFRLGADVDLKWKEIGHLKAGLSASQVHPGLLFSSLIVSGEEIWNMQLQSTQNEHLFAELNLFKNKLGLAYHIYRTTHFSYFDTNFMPVQSSEDLLTQRIELNSRLQWRSLHFNFTGFSQTYESPIFGLPELYGEIDLYYESKWFDRRLHLQMGASLRYTDDYNLPSYMPVIFNFVPSEWNSGDWIPIDFFLQFQIDGFRAFIQSENLTSLWRDGVYYRAAYHPQNDNLIRFGIGWTLLN